jgi:hypothetical protein
MRSLAVVEAWLAVETRLERGPRQEIVAWLNRRKAALEGQR